ncbi:glycosyltransferase family 4 protein [Kluyvera ascorbata]|uniref:glycosyltransferase family 4 protein n=1 Tax=Kluyvera ascorbata TaxID=51288 RepID=UPI00374C9E2B
MKIVYFIPSLYNSGGMERVLTTKVNYFIEHFDCEIFIITTNNFSMKPFFLLDRRIKVIDLNITFYEGNNPLLKILKYIKAQRIYRAKVQQWLNKNNVDICVSYFGREIDFFHKLSGNFSKIGELHFSRYYRKQIYSGISRNVLFNILGAIRDRQLLKNVKNLDRLVVLTEKDRQAWMTDGVGNVFTIMNPSPIAVTNRVNKKAKKVVSIGRFVEQKGFDSLLRIWSKVSDSHPEWCLDIYGDGPLKGKLLEQIDSLKLQNVNLYSFTNDVEQAYSSTTIFALSSQFEGLPMVLIEAQSSGIPSIAYDCPCGPSEIIVDGKTGYLIPLNDEEVFARKLSTLMNSAELQDFMAQQSVNNASKFTLDNIALRWRAIFLELNS